MRAFSRAGGGLRWLAALLVAGGATGEQSTTCAEWQVKFNSIQATWRGPATRGSEVERVFGAPSRVEKAGFCTYLHYAIPGCACSFAVCSEGTVVGKTFTLGATAVPAFLTSDPSELAAAIESLEESLREVQARIAKLQQAVDGLAPPGPLPGIQSVAAPPAPEVRRPVAAAPSTVTPRCASLTKKGARCTRNAAAGSAYCWQHKR